MTAVEDKIRKLLALAQSPNEHEAAAAAEMAQRLMLRYGIEMAEVAGVGEAGEVRVDKRTVKGRVDPWRRTLASAVAQSAGGRVLYGNEPRKWSGAFWFYGPHGTVDGMVATYQYLERELDRISKVEASKVTHINAADSMRWRNSFLRGIAGRVASRLMQRLQEDAGGSQALVVLKSAVDRNIESEHESLRKDNYRGTVDLRAYRQGHDHGGRVGLGDPEVDRTGSSSLPRGD